MNRQVQIGAGIAGLLALLGLAFFVFQPGTSDPVPEAGPRVKPEVAEAMEAKPGQKPAPAKPSEGTEQAKPALEDDAFLALPQFDLPEIENSIEDPLGVLPLTREAMEQSVNEMAGDIKECRDKHLGADAPEALSVDLHFNAEVPPEDYGAPKAGEYGIIRGARVMDVDGDFSAFEACITRSLEDILYDKPEGDGVRINWTLGLTDDDLKEW